VDGATQQTFRIRLDLPAWDPPDEGDEQDEALCAYHVTADDGDVFALRLQISGEVLQSKGVEIIEGAIHNGIRGDRQLVWEPDGVSVVR